MDGDFFIGAALATTLTKLSLHFSETVLKADPKGQTKVNYLTNLIFQLFSFSRKKLNTNFVCFTFLQVNRFVGESMLILASVLHLGQSGLVCKCFYIFLILNFTKKNIFLQPTKAITNDDADRISLCLKVLAESCPENIREIFNQDCRVALNEMIDAQGSTETSLVQLKKSGGLSGIL